MMDSTIRCATSRAWLEKTKLPGFSKAQAESFSFVTESRTLQALADFILAGGKFAGGSFSQQRRHGDYWVSSQMIVLDFDNGVSVADLLKLSYVQDYAWLVYATPSSTIETPKTRLVFVLDQSVTDKAQWIRFARGLYDYFTEQFSHVPNLVIDPASYSPVHSWAGSTNCVEQPYINHAARLPIALIPEYNQPTPKLITIGQGEIAGDVLAQIEQKLGVTKYLPSGYSNPIPCPFGQHEHDATEPGGAWHRDKHIFYCQKCKSKQQYLAKETAAVLSIEWPKSPRPKRSVQHRARAQKQSLSEPNDGRKIVEHISDDLPPAEIAKYRTLLIQGGTGLGKSRAAGEYAKSLSSDDRLTVMAQFRLLLSGLKKYFPQAEHYRDAAPGYQSMLSTAVQLLISLSSAHKIDRGNSDVFIIDEIAGVLKFLTTSDTFKGEESISAYRILKRWVSSAKQLIGMDANLSSIEEDWINPLRGNDLIVKRYRRADMRGIVTLLKDSDTAIWQIRKLLMHKRGQVYVASSSEAKASALSELFSEYRVIKITQDTSNTREVERFIANKDDYRAQFDLVIYDPAMGSGVDISEEVYALVGIFDRMPLDPESAIQLYGRVRNARRYYASVPADSEGYETPTAEQIKADRLNREYWTAQQTGQVVTDKGTWLEMLDLWSKYQERHLREIARWRHYFGKRLKRNGFKVQGNSVGVSKELRATLSAWRKKRKENDWAFVQQANGIALDDATLEKIRIDRKEITHELRLRNTRYKIEKVMGSDQLHDQDRDLMAPQNRGALYRAIQRKNENTLEIDTNESIDGVPLQKRRYSHAELLVVSRLLSTIGFVGKPAEQDEAFIKFFLQEHTDIELKERFAVLTGEDCTKLFKKLGHQTENANTAIGRLKWILNYLWGVKPESHRKGRGENRIMLYHLEKEVVAYLLSRRERAAIAAQQKQAEKCTTNLLNKRESRFVVHPTELTQPAKKLDWLPSVPKPYIQNHDREMVPA